MLSEKMGTHFVKRVHFSQNKWPPKGVNFVNFANSRNVDQVVPQSQSDHLTWETRLYMLSKTSSKLYGEGFKWSMYNNNVKRATTLYLQSVDFFEVNFCWGWLYWGQLFWGRLFWGRPFWCWFFWGWLFWGWLFWGRLFLKVDFFAVDFFEIDFFAVKKIKRKF